MATLSIFKTPGYSYNGNTYKWMLSKSPIEYGFIYYSFLVTSVTPLTDWQYKISTSGIADPLAVGDTVGLYNAQTNERAQAFVMSITGNDINVTLPTYAGGNFTHGIKLGAAASLSLGARLSIRGASPGVITQQPDAFGVVIFDVSALIDASIPGPSSLFPSETIAVDYACFTSFKLIDATDSNSVVITEGTEYYAIIGGDRYAKDFKPYLYIPESGKDAEPLNGFSEMYISEKQPFRLNFIHPEGVNSITIEETRTLLDGSTQVATATSSFPGALISYLVDTYDLSNVSTISIKSKL